MMQLYSCVAYSNKSSAHQGHQGFDLLHKYHPFSTSEDKIEGKIFCAVACDLHETTCTCMCNAGICFFQVSKYEVPIDALQARYPQILGFHFVSTYNGKGVAELQQKLVSVTLPQKYMGEMIPGVWLNFEKKILQERKEASVIDYSILEGKAIDSGIFDRLETSQAVHFLHATLEPCSILIMTS